MIASLGLEESFRALIREVVRDELRAALDVQMHRNAGASSGGDEDGYIPLVRAAELAAVAPGTLRRWIREGRLNACRAGRVFRIRRQELEHFLAGRAPDVAKQAQAFLAT